MFKRLFACVLLTSISAIPAVDAPEARAEVPAASALLAMKVSTEEGYRIEEGFLRIKINGRLNLLQGIIVKKADSNGRLPIMLSTHGTLSSAKERQELTPRGAKDGDLRVLRA